MLNALGLGLSVADLENITVGMLNDLVLEYSDEGYKTATPTDYDAF